MWRSDIGAFGAAGMIRDRLGRIHKLDAEVRLVVEVSLGVVDEATRAEANAAIERLRVNRPDVRVRVT